MTRNRQQWHDHLPTLNTPCNRGAPPMSLFCGVLKGLAVAGELYPEMVFHHVSSRQDSIKITQGTYGMFSISIEN